MESCYYCSYFIVHTSVNLGFLVNPDPTGVVFMQTKLSELLELCKISGEKGSFW